MAYVITDACIDIKDRACVFCCPVDCIYEGLRTLYIQPEECINCGLCVTVCPVDAIYDEHDVPAAQRHFIAINREFFGPEVTGLGSPGSADGKVTPLDHPSVAALPLRER
jgi:NAD-dependent dihydropyrimidine dehydrogenase PreA subunit